MKKYDVVIVGAGPGGLAAAKVLAENNKEVLVLEKNKIIGDKVCAGIINLKRFAIKLPHSILQKKFSHVRFKTPLQDVRLDLNGECAATLDRKDLGDYMEKQAINSGAVIWKEKRVNQISKDSIILEDNKKIQFDYLIGADGSNSIVRKYLNLKNEKLIDAIQYRLKGKIKELEFQFNPVKLGPSYMWIFPYKNSFSIGAWGDLKKSRIVTIKEVKNYLDSYCNDHGIDLKNAKFEGATINYDYRGHEFGNIFLVGDAAGFTPGLICDGINPAILSGIDVAKKILDKNYEFDEIKRILRVKKIEEGILNSLELSKILTEVEIEALVRLLKFKLVDKFVLDHME
ncbi:MAG: NAD(P)/FAD-dependent oxidoreductase [archaeon]